MTQPTGIDWKHVSFAIATRKDHLPATLPRLVFKRQCGNCGAEAYLETELLLDVPVLCNVCAEQVTAQIEDDADTLLLYDMPDDLKARLTAHAHQQGIPPEVVFKDFIEWKLGRPTKAILYRKPEKKNAEE
jgi:hypothetical protein